MSNCHNMVAINELLYLKNAGIQISMFFTSHKQPATMAIEKNQNPWGCFGATSQACRPCDFGRSLNPISTRGDRLCPPNYYWHTRIFRLLNGPASQTALPIQPVYIKNWPYGLNWQCCLSGSSKMAPSILIFSIAKGAKPSFQLKSIAK